MGKPELGWPVWVGLVVEDLERQRAFYGDVLGFRELDAGDDWVWFDMGKGRLFELVAQDPRLPQYAQKGFTISFEVEDIRAAAPDLESRGVHRVTEIEGGPESTQYWCYFRDAEGNLFELVEKLEGPDAIDRDGL